MELQPQWSLSLDYVWNSLAVGAVFKSSQARIILAGADGRIHILAQQKACKRLLSVGFMTLAQEEQVLETKGGCVEHLALFNLLRLNAIELISADVQGTVVIFSNGEILSRSSMTAPVSALVIDTDIGA